MRTEGGPFDTPLSSPPLPIIGRGVFTENILVQNTIFFFPKVPPLPSLRQAQGKYWERGLGGEGRCRYPKSLILCYAPFGEGLAYFFSLTFIHDFNSKLDEYAVIFR